MQYKDFFDRYDALGTLHPGFLQSMDLSAYTDIEFLNELTANLMDAYLYNELSDSLVLKRWKHYLVWDKAENRFEIKSAFYADFAAAVYAYLAKKQRWWELAHTNFTSLSATDIKTIEHGLKETEMDYGATQETNQYGQQQRTDVHGAKSVTNQYGQQQRTDMHGAQSVTRNYDKVEVKVERAQDSHVTGAESGSSSETVTNKVFPLGASAYVDDTQSSSSGTTSAQARTDTDTWGDQDTTTKAREDGESRAAFTDTSTDAQHSDTSSTQSYTDTSTDAQHTDTKSTIAKQDKETVKAYVDTERHTKYIVISPEKIYEINKELVEIGAYDLMLEAVKETMLLEVWEVEPW